jgi:hypothetical protein
VAPARIRRRRRWLVAAVAAATLAGAAHLGLADRRHAAFTVAVAPFYGPDADSDKEARVMGALIATELGRRLPDDEVDVLGAEDVKTVVRSRRAARALAEELEADVLVWGEALSFQGEVELASRLTTRAGLLIEASEGGAMAARGGAIETRRARASAVADHVAALYSQRVGRKTD